MSFRNITTPPVPVTTFANRVWPYYPIAGNAILPNQGGLFNRRFVGWNPANGTSGSTYGGAGSPSAGTVAFAAPTTTNFYTNQARNTFASVVTTANQQVGVNSAEGLWSRQSSLQGGFFFACRFGFETWTAGDRLFIGLAAVAAISALVTAQPSSVVNMVGFGIDASDTAITFMHNDGSGTAVKDTIAGQPSLASNQGYSAFIYAKPSDTVVYYRLDDLNAGTIIIDTNASSDLPATGTLMKVGMVMGNAANANAGDAKLGLANWYIESD